MIFSYAITKIKAQTPLLAKFFSSQIAIQLLNVLNGFMLLRWLSIEEQAIFGIAFGIQTLINGLSDLGFTGSIVALSGEKFADKKVLGSYMSSAKQLRTMFFIISLLFSLCLAPFILKNSFSNSYIIWISLVPVLATVYWQANASIYGTPLIIHKQLKSYYKPQIIISGLKIVINFLLFLSHSISALTILVFNALFILFVGRQYKKLAGDYYERNTDTTKAKKHMLKYLLPMMPSNIFNSFFGQFQIFIVAYFGKVSNIAEVAALGRLSQLFLLLSAFNMMIVEPMIAKSNYSTLFKKYLFLTASAVVIGAILTITAYVYPNIYLMILGNKYTHLSKQVVWLLASASISFIAGTIWTMSSARKWVFWWGSIFYIISIIICQVWGIVYYDLSTTEGVLRLSLLTSIGVLIVQVCITIVGFRKERILSKVLPV